jgi:hypothetical protein
LTHYAGVEIARLNEKCRTAAFLSHCILSRSRDETRAQSYLFKVCGPLPHKGLLTAPGVNDLHRGLLYCSGAHDANNGWPWYFDVQRKTAQAAIRMVVSN